MKSYIGFFALLWFNWLQVALYDVRFSVDSVFERVCKGLHLGIMIAFAVVGTQFDASDTAKSAVVFQQFSVIMMVSKVILLIQYSYVLFWVRGHGKIVIPLLIHILTFTLGAAVCVGLVFTFEKGKTSRSYLAWYGVALLEALAVFISSSRWRSVSFKRTHLHERVGLLTLIILGEGVIVLTKSMNFVTKAQNYSPAVTGQIISSTLIIYFIYMLYFDQVDIKRFGTIRQQFWALAHFPFHVALVLLLEGTSRFVIWRNAMETVDDVVSGLEEVLLNSSDVGEIARMLRVTVRNVANYDSGLDKIIAAESFKWNITSAFDALAASPNVESAQATNATNSIVNLILRSVFEFFSLKPPKTDTKITFSPTDPKNPLSEVYSMLHFYDLVYIYFFVAAGCTLLMMSILIALAKKNKCLGDYVFITLRAVVGLGLAGVAAVRTDANTQARFLMSPWILPTVMLALGVVVALDGVLGYYLPAAPPSPASTPNTQDYGSLKGGEGKKYHAESVSDSEDEV